METGFTPKTNFMNRKLKPAAFFDITEKCVSDNEIVN